MANWRLYNDVIYNSDSSSNNDHHQSKSPLTEKEALELHRRVFDVSYREEFNGEIFDRKKSVRYLKEYLRYKSQLPKMKVDICETEILDSEHFRYTLNWQYQQTQTQQSTTDETTMTSTTKKTHENMKTISTADPADAVDDMTTTTTNDERELARQ
jgi:hypothetical protein